jgi:hypothetical protein
MKIYIFLAILMISIDSNGQVYRFRSFENALTTPSGQPSDFKWKSESVLIVHDFENNTLKFYTNGKESTLAIVESSPEEIKPTEGNLSSRMKYTAIDQYGEKCIVEIEAFKQKSNGYGVLFYCWYSKNEIMIYKANIIE